MDIKFLTKTLSVYVLIFLFRIPTSFTLTGNDAFEVSYFAHKIVSFEAGKFLIHPLSYFGIYPFSAYPIFSYLFLGILIFIFQDTFTSWVIYSFIVGLIAYHSFKYLARELCISNKLHELGGIIYSLSIPLLTYSSWSVGSRGLFLAFVPLYFSKYFKLINSKITIRNYSLLIIFSIFFTLIHYIGWTLLIFSFGSPIVKKIVNCEFSLNLFTNISILMSLLISIVVLYLRPSGLIFIGVSGLFDTSKFYGFYIESIIDIFLRVGYPIILGTIFVISINMKEVMAFVHQENYIKQIKFLSTSTVFFFPIISRPYYLPMLHDALFVSLSLMMFQLLSKLDNHSILKIISIISYIGYIGVILIGIGLIKPIPILVQFEANIIMDMSLFFLAIALIFHKPIRRRKLLPKIAAIFVISLLLLSNHYYISTITITQNSIQKEYITKEEIEFGNFLLNKSISSRILSGHYILARKLSGFTGLEFYYNTHGGNLLITGNTANDIDVSGIKPPLQWLDNPIIFNYNKSIQPNYERNLVLFGANTSYSNIIHVLEKYNTCYFVNYLQYNLNGTTIYSNRQSDFLTESVNNNTLLEVYRDNFFIMYSFIFEWCI